MATATTTRRLESLRSARLKEALVGYGFVLVPMGYFLLFFIFPIGYAVYISSTTGASSGRSSRSASRTTGCCSTTSCSGAR